MDSALIVDCQNLCIRCWWPCRGLTTSTGISSGLEFGFIRNLILLAKAHYPAKVHLTWDGKPSRGIAIDPNYKSTRAGGALTERQIKINSLMSAFSKVVSSYFDADLEADEQIARLVCDRERRGLKSTIISTDADYHQFASDLTKIKTKLSSAIIDSETVLNKWGVPPSKLPLLRAMAGDKSDNLRGVPGVPKSIKVRLALEANDINHLIELCDSALFLTDKQRTILQTSSIKIKNNFKIINLRDRTELPVLILPATSNLQDVFSLCQQLELNSLLKSKDWPYLFGL